LPAVDFEVVVSSIQLIVIVGGLNSASKAPRRKTFAPAGAFLFAAGGRCNQAEIWIVCSNKRVTTMKRNVVANLRAGKAGWILLWLLGVPIPVLFILFMLRGCT